MLQINRILLKKIKYPLSLRGERQRSNLSGFSLIELMVAVTILALAAVGIFQAFTVGFQSMADAKYRTVATNIAQEKLEEVKNSVKVAYPYYSTDTQEVNDTTYTIIVTTHSQEDNLEQVYVTVSWHDRRGNEKNVQLETLVYDLKIDYNVAGPDIGRIHLSANPTVITCCVVGEASTITAELFNTADPEQRVPSGTPVSFNANGGSVDPEFTVTDTIGKAITQLTLNGKNPAYVTATSGLVSSSDIGSDGAPLEVTCIPKPGEIVLSASPSAITPEISSTITATVTDTCGDLLSEESGQVDVKFVTNFGSFDASESITEITETTVDSIATITLYSLNSGEVATINGTITVDEVDISDSTTVICTNYSISVIANPTSINPGGDNDTSIITAVLTQSGGSPAVGETISFTTDMGSLSAATATTDSNGQAVVTLSSLSGGNIATITASYEIIPGNTISDTATVQCSEYVIHIVANPDKVIPGSPTTITATLTNYEGNPAANKGIAFISNKGILSDDSVYTDSNGIATTTLTMNTVGDIANVSATYGFAADTVNVYCIEFILEVSANPESTSPGESSVITALLTNYSGIPQSGQTITFTTDHGNFSETSGTTATAVTNGSGEAVVHLILNTVGTAIVTAEYDIVEDTVTVECSDTYITLNNPSNIDVYGWSNNYVRFDLYLHGGPLTVDKVKINWQTSWGNPSRYYQIWIEQPIGGSQTEIYNNTGWWGSHANLNTTETLDSEYTISANSSFRIRISFISSIRNNHITFTFNPDDPGAEENYQVDFYTGW